MNKEQRKLASQIFIGILITAGLIFALNGAYHFLTMANTIMNYVGGMMLAGILGVVVFYVIWTLRTEKSEKANKNTSESKEQNK